MAPTGFLGAILILLIGTVVHILILREVGDKGGPRSLFTIVIMSIVSTFEMFFGSTKMFDNGIQEVLFGKDPVPAHTINLILLTAVYVAAMITTAYLIFIFFLRHMNSRIWLWVKQLVDFDGNVLEPFVIDYTSTLSYVVELISASTLSYVVELISAGYDADGDYHGQYHASKLEPQLVVYHVNEYQGLMDAHTGKIITPAKYGEIKMISRELLRAEVNIFNYESVLLDRKGNVIKK